MAPPMPSPKLKVRDAPGFVFPPAAGIGRLILRRRLAMRRVSWMLGLAAMLLLITAHASAAALPKQQTVGSIYAWGVNANGQLGNGSTNYSPNPTVLPNLPSVIAVAAAGDHTLALQSNGAVWAWGSNSVGQLGSGTTTNSLAPVQVSGLTGVVAIAGGETDSFALTSNGTVWAWGNKATGQLGNSTTASSLDPVQVTSLTGVVAVAASDGFGLALTQQRIPYRRIVEAMALTPK